MNLLIFLSGVLVRNGGSFEDDLSLGAEGMFGGTVFSYSFKIKKRKWHVFRFMTLRIKVLESGSGTFYRNFYVLI